MPQHSSSVPILSAAQPPHRRNDPVIADLPPVSSWYDSYSLWLNRTSSPYRTSLVNGRAPNQTVFYAWLNEWLARDGRAFQDSILFNSTTGRIYGSKISAFTKDVVDGDFAIRIVDSTRWTVENAAPNLQVSSSVRLVVRWLIGWLAGWRTSMASILPAFPVCRPLRTVSRTPSGTASRASRPEPSATWPSRPQPCSSSL